MPDGAIHSDLTAALPQTSATSGEAYLLALGALFEAANARERAAYADAEGADEDAPRNKIADLLNDATSSIVNQILLAHAISIDGVLVKVRAVHWCRSGDEVGPEVFGYYSGLQQGSETLDERLIVGVLADLYRMAGFPIDNAPVQGDAA